MKFPTAMSLASYKQNERKKVASPNLPVCFPAAIEQVSPDDRYRPDVYLDYRDFIERWAGVSHKGRQSQEYVEDELEAYENLAWPLGGMSWEDMIWKRVNTTLGFLRAVNQFMREEYRVIVDLTYNGPANAGVHAVGLLPTGEEGYVTLVSNHVHKTLQGIVNLHQVAKHVGYSDDRHIPDYPFHDANIVAIPPAY